MQNTITSQNDDDPYQSYQSLQKFLKRLSTNQYKSKQSDETGDMARKQPCIDKITNIGPYKSNQLKEAQYFQKIDFKRKQSDETGDMTRKQPCIDNITNIGPYKSNQLNEAQWRYIKSENTSKIIMMYKAEWDFLNTHLKTQLDKIQQDNKCYFQLSNEQNIRIDPILKFNGKKIIFCGDIDNQKYDAQIVEGEQDFMEPQLIKDNKNANIIHISSSPQSQMRQQSEYFRSNITQIFEIAQNKRYQSLVIPIFGESQIFSFETACKEVVTTVIKQIKHSYFTNNIIIFEGVPQKQQIILNTLLDLLNPQNRPVKYQWQWQQQDGCWIDYDEEINQQIDEAYEKYQNDRSKYEVEINIPYFNTYQILKKKEKIKFTNKSIIQVDLETKLERKVQFKYFLNTQQTNLLLDNFELQLEKSQSQSKYQIILDIKSLDDNKFQIIERQLRDLLEKNQQKFNWKVKNFKDDDLITIENTIRKKSIQFQGLIKQGNELLIKCFVKKAKKLQDYLNDIEKQFIIFPQEWVPYKSNFFKVCLNYNDEDYKKVQQLFQQSYPQGKVFQISRIQNKILYENFINEKKKLIQVKQTQRQALNQTELSTYLWHGVKNNHPSIIYNGIQEAFKNNYCNLACMWGPGIYFSSKATYSKSYAYKLTSKECAYYQNKLVFLLCEVATGKCVNLAPNNGLKEPPYGYDCVVGKQLDTDIYVLYGMDVRRAYPSFEIIFE